MSVSRKAAILVGLLALAACQPSINQALVYNALVADTSLAKSYHNMADFSSVQTTAATIRNSAVFQIQKFAWPGSGTKHFSLSNANVEYAHALGLTGAGQTISIVDNGFLTTHDELTGKSITTPSGYAPGVNDHGTAVAAIAASTGGGNMIGVAPGANLQLGSFNSFAAMTAATNQARSIGAIVQNNSWGYSVSATQSNYNSVFGSSSGQAYINSLQNFANNGVIVFAASNDVHQSHIDLVSGLPNLVPGLEMSFITAINAAPKFNGSGQITSATLLSSRCLQAARYCIIADGSVYSASGTGNSDYMLWSGTSFSAPQVAGAIAILAQAFPGLSAQELRARLLASANNSWFTHTGVVNFSDTVQHGFSTTWGHGFLDVGAALLPIGGSYVRVSNSASLPLGTPLVISRGAAGNALTRGLARHQMNFRDGMGSSFDVSAAALSAYATTITDPADFAQERLAAGGGDRVLSDGFGSYVPGQEMSVDLGGPAVDFLVPAAGEAAQTMGVSLHIPGASGVSFGLTGLVEGGSMLGVGLGGDTGQANSLQGAASVEWTQALAPGLSLGFGARMGVAVPAASNGPVGFGATRFDEFAMTLGARDLGRAGDRLSFRVALPQAVADGKAAIMLPVTMSGSAKPAFRSVDISMVPEARQVDLSIDYARPLAGDAEIVFSAAHSVNAGNIAGERNSSVAIGWRIQF